MLLRLNYHGFMYIHRIIEKLLPGIIASFPCLAITGPQQSSGVSPVDAAFVRAVQPDA